MISKPKIFRSKEEVPADAKIIDAHDSMLAELFSLSRPDLKDKTAQRQEAENLFFTESRVGEVWIYFPHVNTAVRSVPEDDYFKLRTARNKQLLTAEVQQAYRDFVVGVAGLSVGSSAVSALCISGGPKTMKIADFDVIEVTNLNRIRGTILDVGTNKAEVAAREVWEVDPFADVSIWGNGLTLENINDFILGTPRLGAFIDSMDSINLKVIARMICRENKIPVLMCTDNGDNVILDVERFDLEPDRKLFHGLVGDIDPEQIKTMDYKSWLKLATQIVGPEYLTGEMMDSLLEIGKTIAGVPQLGTTAAIAGAAMAFVVRRIAAKQEMPSGRYVISLEEKLISDFNQPENVEKRKQKLGEFLEKFSKKMAN